jgi:hypothetical protein
MATTNGNRKILDLKRWEFLATAPVTQDTAMFIASSRHYRQQQMYFAGNSSIWLYQPDEDGWIPIPNSGLGTLTSGACGTAVSWSTGATLGVAFLTATAGTTSTITTNQTLARDLRGFSIHILEGPNAGVTLPILSNTTGANAVITVATQASAFTNATRYRLMTPRWFVNSGGTQGSTWRFYDFATNTWSANLSITNLAASIGTDARVIATPSWIDTDYVKFHEFLATGTGGSAVEDSTANWAIDQWKNFQVRIVSGTGAGQIRTVASNTATLLTLTAAWTTPPDIDSTISIEGNDDFIYCMGNAAVTLYRYSISTNTWSVLTPAVARGGNPGGNLSGHWVWDCSDSAWTNTNSIINGRRIYSFRGGASNVLDYYDIAANTWVNSIVYGPAFETFTTGTRYSYNGNFLYIQKDATHRFYKYSFVTSELLPFAQLQYPSGGARVGDCMFDVIYKDGATKITYIYNLINNSAVMARIMVI